MDYDLLFIGIEWFLVSLSCRFSSTEWYHVLYLDVDVFLFNYWICNVVLQIVFMVGRILFFNCYLEIVTPSTVRKFLFEVFQIIGFLSFRLSFKIVNFCFNLYMSRWWGKLKFLRLRMIPNSTWGSNNFLLYCIVFWWVNVMWCIPFDFCNKKYFFVLLGW